ncbi:HLH transcription factor-like protein [Plenodomus tracheiphilus IPT5]|uniref:HLH transcription factor-like protein n=1 Tax=Plenodomus tracheiphilus IPT5 TaxID=1408161 RepID=A0A6A7BP42_9PLEO|nr:HLH transcription factor-like protein [Plenodomus tracheiphilus IPT5]
MYYGTILTVPQADSFFTPPSSYSPQKTLARLDLGLDSPSDDVLDADIFNMTGTGSPQPFIKEEVDDMSFNTNRFVGHNGFDMNQQYANPQFGSNHDNVNPSELNMSQSMMGGQFGSTSYIQGAAGIADDELADSLGGGYDQQQNYNSFGQGNTNHQDYYHSHTNNPTINQIYSNTPDDLPIQSPFVHPGAFDFNQYHTPSRINFPGSMSNAMRPARASMSRHASDSRTPMSPKTPALTSLNIGTPDSGNFTTQPIMTNTRGGHKSTVSMSNPGSMPWEGTPGSPHSWIDSPASPHTATMHHQQIADVLHSGKHSSLPAKVDIGQTQDAKKRRRRESHNLVERRRRDNINERIHDLSRLVPQHRLEDEKIRKHINNNGPMSPTMGTSGMSPPQATSLLAGGSGRRAAGNITQGLPIEDKDKGPNKGDILNGAVSWTRDLMWMLHKKIQECDELAARLQQATGEEWATEQTEDEKRMKTEIMEALEKNGTGTFRYSRGPGSGLRVPHHTNLAGEPVNGISPQSLSPGMQSTGSGSGSNQQYWSNQSLKEEDEYGMDMG